MHRHECTLRAVNDRGVVIEHKGATGFHPWNSVNAIQHGELEQAAPVSFPSRGSKRCVDQSFYSVEQAAKVLQLTPGRIRLTLRDGLMTDPAGGGGA